VTATDEVAATAVPPAEGGRRRRYVPRWLSAVIAGSRRLLARPRAPLELLGALSLASLLARAGWLDRPSGPSGGALIFDEKYYVNAARVLLHLSIPCYPDKGCDPYGAIDGGTDPNAEHPPLGKLFIASGMRIFGDNQLGWRITPLIFGSLAILAMYWMVRSAGGSSWLALGASSLLAIDNLFLVHGRIGTLDIFVLVFMLVGVAIYLRGHPLIAGLFLGVGACVKLVAPFALIALILIEVLRIAVRREWQAPQRWKALLARAVPLLLCSAASAVVYFGLLDVLDILFKPYHNPLDACPGSGSTYANSLVHTRFMLCYAGKLTSPNGPIGIASYPWQWLLDLDPINYYSVDVTTSVGNVSVRHTAIAFIGLMNPAIIYLALPALAVAVYNAIRDRDDVAILVVAWFLATYVPLVLASALEQRTSYLYYMLTVLPAVCLGAARFISKRWLPPRIRIAIRVIYMLILIGAFWFLYPIREFPFGAFT
jgi:dolichyl-phosphate-mannose--protein O-mannosyl transferase